MEGKGEKAKDHGPLPLMLVLPPGLSVPASTASLPTIFSAVELAGGTPSDTIMYGKISTQLALVKYEALMQWELWISWSGCVNWRLNKRGFWR